MTDKTENDQAAAAPEGERIAKVMARAGLCSRRDAERWIAEGRVAVNGRVLESPAFNVVESDKVVVDGRPIARRERTRLFLFHKPRGTVTTDRDPEGRQTIFEALPEGLPRLVTIGRLDINTEGLLLLTNDGGLARVLELPATGWLRRYRVRAHGAIDQAQLDALAAGVVIEGVEYRGIEARIDRVQGANVWLTMGLREGKNREIKRVLEHLGLSVNRLIRVSYGPFQLGELEEGAVEEVKTRILKDQLGDKLAAEAGVDFEGSVLDKKDVEKIARRHPRESESERPSGRGGERPARRPARSEGRDENERPLSARDVIPRKRKHVSVMRAEKAEAGERRRIERAETADRRGRAVAVERVVAGAPRDEKPEGRNARRFARERDGKGGERTLRRPRPAGEGAGKAGSRDNRSGWRRPEGDEARPARRERPEGRSWSKPKDAARPERAGERPDRAPRGERPQRRDEAGGGRAPGRSWEKREAGASRPPRGERPERSERPARGERPEGRSWSKPKDGARPERAGERPDRAPRGERPQRRDEAGGGRAPGRSWEKRDAGGARPPRRERPEGGASRGPTGERPARAGGGFAGKGAGGGRGAGKGPGKPGGFRSGKPGGGRPGGGKPGGGKPGGAPRSGGPRGKGPRPPH